MESKKQKAEPGIGYDNRGGSRKEINIYIFAFLLTQPSTSYSNPLFSSHSSPILFLIYSPITILFPPFCLTQKPIPLLPFPNKGRKKRALTRGGIGIDIEIYRYRDI